MAACHHHWILHTTEASEAAHRRWGAYEVNRNGSPGPVRRGGYTPATSNTTPVHDTNVFFCCHCLHWRRQMADDIIWVAD